jgi:NADP-dependent 3-hydroxy acid dehydrogenase YdfG
MDKRNLEGKTAIVLGGSSAYGAAAVRALARESVNVVLGGRDRDRLETLEEEAQILGGEALVVGTHLAKRHHPAHLVEAAVEAFGDWTCCCSWPGLPLLPWRASTWPPGKTR